MKLSEAFEILKQSVPHSFCIGMDAWHRGNDRPIEIEWNAYVVEPANKLYRASTIEGIVAAVSTDYKPDPSPLAAVDEQLDSSTPSVVASAANRDTEGEI